MTVSPPLRVTRTIVLVGLMGAGKTSIGRRLALRLGLPFFDADTEIEAAAGETIEEIFAQSRRARLPRRRAAGHRPAARPSPVHVLATGGGAFMDPATRALIARRGVSLWLRADLDVLLSRVARRSNRPLLEARRSARDPRRADRAALSDLRRGRHDRRQRRRTAGSDA